MRRPAALADAIVAFVRENQGATCGEIARAIGHYSAGTMPPALAAQGRLARSNADGGKWRYYLPGAEPKVRVT